MKIKLFGSGKTFTQQEFSENLAKLRNAVMKTFEDGTSIKDKNMYYRNYK